MQGQTRDASIDLRPVAHYPQMPPTAAWRDAPAKSESLDTGSTLSQFGALYLLTNDNISATV